MEILPHINPIVFETVTEVHKNYCKDCPSNRAVFPIPDPEAADYEALPDGERQRYVFPCGWRPNKLCKGVCESLDYDESKHAELIKEREI
jgi:hypothetical protein